ncbi:peptidoglycan-binding protein LysM [Candidatus Methylospira mobilis]|uniref:Potassium binding protein Kbp n=1 Tax=Candidatus Methylospira mobilis TaxID=1808979 RepID=A0A5Q0BLD0_9GAMM|nr:peptidoglycan-binding protein LysM [Candidatus Methylospira mobilis]QFY42907.1 peptidoglycan-binding protein LysM [Candidatus Methylospira mobilis]
MGLFSFIKDAGEKLLGGASSEDQESANRSASAAITAHVQSLQLPVTELHVAVEKAAHSAEVSGSVPDQETCEKVILACGNVEGIDSINDKLYIAGNNGAATGEAVFHTVAGGETLSAIAKKHYGNANGYTAIFEANKPMLKHPDKIYPGQVLRIPPQTASV